MKPQDNPSQVNEAAWWRGTYVSNATYDKGEAVFYNGSSYICLEYDVTGVTPDDAAPEWALLAQAGADGAAASHPDLSTHDALGLATDAELAAHTGDTADAHDASAISVLDTGGKLAATDVEAALAEVATDHDNHLADTVGAHNAEAVSFDDPGALYTAITVEAALSEVKAQANAHEADITDAHDASAISFVPAGTIAATDVQAAIEEVMAEAGGGAHPDLATHDALGLATDAELSTHAGAADPHTGYARKAATNTFTVRQVIGSSGLADIPLELLRDNLAYGVLLKMTKGSAIWCIGLGNEAIPYLYIGGSAGSSQYFWRANWNSTSDPANTFRSPSGTAGQVPLAVKGATAQSAHLQEWQDVDANVLAFVGTDGALTHKTNKAVLDTDHTAAADPHPGYLTQAEGDGLYEPLGVTLNDLTDVDTTGAANGKVIKHNGTSWVVGDDNVGAGGSAHVLKEAGTPLTQRAGMNFGAGFDLADDAANDETDVALDLSEVTILHSSLGGITENDHHLRSHDHSAAGDSSTLDPVTLLLPSSANPTPTAEASVAWDSDDDTIKVGDGAATREFGRLGTTVASTQAFGDAAAAGTSKEVTRTDHKHAMPANPVTAHEAAGDPHTGYLQESAAVKFTIGGVLLDPTAARTIEVWRAPFACTITGYRARVVGGTNAVTNAQVDATDILTGDLTTAPADGWEAGTVKSDGTESVTAGEVIKFEVVSVSGAVTEVTWQLELTRAALV